jgi:hypothetical protein
VNGFEGLNKRIASYLPPRQSISIGTAYDCTADSAHEHKLIDALHNLIDLAGLRKAPTINVGKGKQGNASAPMAKQGALLMNRDMYLGVAKVLRRLGLLDTTQDGYGREFASFDGVPMIDVGIKDITESSANEIIANNYGPFSNETRVYAVRFGMDDGLTAVQLNTPDAYDPLGGAEKTTGPQKLLRIDWWVGLAGFGSYYAARLTGIKDPTQWT